MPVKMTLTKEQLNLLHHTLLCRKMYATTPVALGVTLWQPYMEDLLQSIETALSTIHHEQVLTSTLQTGQH